MYSSSALPLPAFSSEMSVVIGVAGIDTGTSPERLDDGKLNACAKLAVISRILKFNSLDLIIAVIGGSFKPVG